MDLAGQHSYLQWGDLMTLRTKKTKGINFQALLTVVVQAVHIFALLFDKEIQ